MDIHEFLLSVGYDAHVMSMGIKYQTMVGDVLSIIRYHNNGNRYELYVY